MGKYSQELVSYQGYVLVWHNGKRRRKHIVVWEQEHQACLCDWGIVHHKDHNRQNNDPSNLEAMMRGNHASVHHKGIPKTKEIRQRMREAALSNQEVMERKRLIMLGNRRWVRDKHHQSRPNEDR